jgi:2,3-bisphosphoglycerate-independent phosphoglycerate mutase
MNGGRHVLIFFLDGVGLGESDPEINPFVNARLPNLTGLLGENWYLRDQPPRSRQRASLVPTNTTLGVPGLPQSATGQATILTGRNVPQLIGEHYGPKPNGAIAGQIAAGTLFGEVVGAGGTAALLTPYPQRYFDAIDSGRRLLSAVPLAATGAGVPLRTVDDLRAGKAISPDFTAQGWHDQLGYDDVPVVSPAEAGARIAALAQAHTFSFFEHWPSDRSGHRGSLQQAVEHLELIDEALGGLLDAWDDDSALLMITSDHGNIEAKDRRQHTANPVPTILVGMGHDALAPVIRDLTDIAPVVRTFLEL